MAPAQVAVMRLELRDVPVNFEYVGQVAGSNEVEVHARVTGVIEKRLYKEGGAVKSGQTLFQLDDAPFRAALDQAEAALAVARAQRASAQAQYRKAQRGYARTAPLAEKKLLSQSQLDDALSALDVAKAAVQQAEAAIQQAEAGVRTAHINLDYTQIKAPLDGVAGRALQHEGSLVQAGNNNGLLTTVAQTDPAYIDFGIAESEHQALRQSIADGSLSLPGEGFNVVLKTTDGARVGPDGHMNFQDYKVDEQTGNVAMRATIDNSNHQLLPGQFVRVLLEGGKRPQALVVPQRAVLDNPQGKYVYVVGKNDKGVDVAQPHPVEVGEWARLDGEMKNAWIIKSGLKPGDEVIVEGTARIFFPGMPVQTAAPEAAKPAGVGQADGKTSAKE